MEHEIPTMEPEEFAEKFLPVLEARDAAPDMPDEYYVMNRETGKLELHFEKSTYDDLSSQDKARIKSAFVWGRKTGCWISRCKEPNLYHAVSVARSLGLADAGKTGERLTFAQQMEQKALKAERRAERYEALGNAAHKRGDALQKPINDMHGDIAFFTQPNINSSAGRAFTRRRDRMFAAFDRGFQEYRKSEYFQDRAKIARRTAGMKQLNDKGFIVRRIAECEAEIRKLKRDIEEVEQMKEKILRGETVRRYGGTPFTLDDVDGIMNDDLDRMEVQLDKLGYYQDALDALGGVAYSRDNIAVGFVVNVKHYGKCTVVSAGPKNISYRTDDGFVLTCSYGEIESIVSTKITYELHPFRVGEQFTVGRWNDKKQNCETVTYRIIRASDKSVTLQTGDEKPIVRKPTRVPWSQTPRWMLHLSDWSNGTIYRDAEHNSTPT